MNWQIIIGITAGVIQIFSIVPYIKGMIYGRTRPNIVTWALWTVLQIIVIAAQFSAGASWSVIILIVMTFNTTLVLALCLFGYGYKKYNYLDYICFALAIFAIVIWQITDKPILAIVFAIIADFLALIPTVVKTYREPYSEQIFAWILNIIAGILAGLSTTKIDFANLAFPIYYVLSDSGVVLLAWWRRGIGK